MYRAGSSVLIFQTSPLCNFIEKFKPVNAQSADFWRNIGLNFPDFEEINAIVILLENRPFYVSQFKFDRSILDKKSDI